MQKNSLSKRLQYLLNICPNFDVYADVGCDHGYIAYNLLKLNKCKFVYCIDIHSKSLEKAKNIIISNAKFFCSDGFKKLTQQERNEIDCAIIAGMGGVETINILNEFQPQNFILQPMHNQKELRQYLLDNNYNITLDKMFCEKEKFYCFLVCKKSENITKYTNFEIEFGKYENNLDYINYLNTQKQKYLTIYNKTNNENILNILQNIENVLKYNK